MQKKTRRRMVYGYLKVPSFEILNDNLTFTLNNHLQTQALTQTPSNEVFSHTSSLTSLYGSNNQDESASNAPSFLWNLPYRPKKSKESILRVPNVFTDGK